MATALLRVDAARPLEAVGLTVAAELTIQAYSVLDAYIYGYALGGGLRILPTEKLREQIAQIGRRVVADHPGALRILAEHDPDR